MGLSIETVDRVCRRFTRRPAQRVTLATLAWLVSQTEAIKRLFEFECPWRASERAMTVSGPPVQCVILLDGELMPNGQVHAHTKSGRINDSGDAAYEPALCVLNILILMMREHLALGAACAGASAQTTGLPVNSGQFQIPSKRPEPLQKGEVYIGHRSIGWYASGWPEHEPVYAVTLRSPLSRVSSMYDQKATFSRPLPLPEQTVAIQKAEAALSAEGVPQDRYLDTLLNRNSSVGWNVVDGMSQVSLLLPDLGEGCGDNEDTTMAIALRNLLRCDVVGIVEQFDGFALQARSQMPHACLPDVPVANMHKRKQQVLSPQVMDRVMEHPKVQLDAKLYSFATRLQAVLTKAAAGRCTGLQGDMDRCSIELNNYEYRLLANFTIPQQYQHCLVPPRTRRTLLSTHNEPFAIKTLSLSSDCNCRRRASDFRLAAKVAGRGVIRISKGSTRVFGSEGDE